MTIIEPMTADDWLAVRRIYAEGIATGDATLEREAPDWAHFDHSHPPECRLVARDGANGDVVGWTALGGYSSRKVYRGVAWESVYVAAEARGRGVGRTLLEALIPASEAAGYWTLLAGVPARTRWLPADRRPTGPRPGRDRTMAGRRGPRAPQLDRRGLTRGLNVRPRRRRHRV
jgi:L-amino acid N-acyltransferase YncA